VNVERFSLGGLFIFWHGERIAHGHHALRTEAWFERLNGARQFKGGEPLAHKGKTISRKNAVTDGPFAESKEAIAGFFIIQADGLEQAVEIAKDCPGLEFGQTVEVRALDSEPHELRIARQRIAARNKG
jgi:hypothetical protein